ncbi:membrane-targeted effector domain-containing toxin [Pseudomonas poae]|uniref:membrane-targeted effector domain-containing toxin n=1 Tax=Pseudomonas poae TaxID=200451 RepID=UPI00223C2386|nr:membrane-targeted effector domain-containing toxin [Pseudomonas poae]
MTIVAKPPYLPPTIPTPEAGPEAPPAHHGIRIKRHIDSAPPKQQLLGVEVKPDPTSDGYVEVNVDLAPGKNVANTDKTPTPINLGPNINIDPSAEAISGAFKTVEQQASDFLKKKFAEMKAKETGDKAKWDIDPDTTYLVTYDYNSKGSPPHPAKIVQRISLTQAMIQNAQKTPTGKGYEVPFFTGGPDVHVQNHLPTHKPGVFDFPSRLNPNSKTADVTHSYQGIYREPPNSPTQHYNASNQSAVTPAQFKSLIWKADFQKPYTQFLDEFWSTHQEKYPVLAKASLVKAAMAQHQEGSLSARGRELVMRAAGLSGNQQSWPDINYEDLQKNPPKDPDIEVGLLKIGEYQSTDLMYITDNKVRFDADGKKLPPMTLLYIPGNSSPLHTFNSPAAMKTWLAAQMADPAKRAALSSHFALKDKPMGWARAGVDETLAGLGAWPKARETPGGLLSYNHRAFSGKWDPQTYIKTEPSTLPFAEVTRRQKERSYADAAVKITSDADVTKQGVLDRLEQIGKMALFMTPLAMVVPEVALGLDAFYVVSGITTAGIGVDDQVQGKPKGTDRVVFGVFNAVVTVAPHIGRAGRDEPTVINPTEKPQVHVETDDANLPLKNEAPAATANRLRPSQWNDISAYVVPDGEKLLTNSTPDAKGIYQVKGSQGEDRWLIKLADDKNAEHVFEIKGKFSNGYAQVIDPQTRKPVMTVHATADGTWTPLNGPGGIKWPWQAEKPFDPAAYDYPATGEPSSSSASKKIDKQLKKDADDFHKNAKSKARPVHSPLPKKASLAETINSLFKKTTGLVFGEDHSQSATLRLLIDNAGEFKRNNVRVLYSEGFDHSLQPDLDRFYETGEISPKLRENLKIIDRAHAAHKPYTNEQLLVTMRSNGIRVKAIDVPSSESKTTRIKNMNYYAANVIERDQAAHPGEKWIARVGSDHVVTYDSHPPIRGVPELTGSTGITVDEAVANKGTSIIQSRDKTEVYIDM